MLSLIVLAFRGDADILIPVHLHENMATGRGVDCHCSFTNGDISMDKVITFAWSHAMMIIRTIVMCGTTSLLPSCEPVFMVGYLVRISDYSIEHSMHAVESSPQLACLPWRGRPSVRRRLNWQCWRSHYLRWTFMLLVAWPAKCRCNIRSHHACCVPVTARVRV